MISRNRSSRFARAGVALLDVMLAIVVLSIVVVAAVPALRPSEGLKLVSAATVLAADIEFAQSSSIDKPTDPTIVRVDDKEGRYWLARASAPQTPIERPDGTPWLVDFASGKQAYLQGLGLRLENGVNDAVVFDGFGRLTASADARIVLVSPAGELPVRIASSTGSVSIGE